MMEIYIGGRQTGKTTMLIKESARTGATIAVATYKMVEYIVSLSKQMGLEIPCPVPYTDIFVNYWADEKTRYLVDDLQMMLGQYKIDTATIDDETVRYMNKKRLMKVIVDELPEKSEDCIFSDYIQMTSKYKCMFQNGMYSRCALDCGGECPYLKKGE